MKTRWLSITRFVATSRREYRETLPCAHTIYEIFGLRQKQRIAHLPTEDNGCFYWIPTVIHPDVAPLVCGRQAVTPGTHLASLTTDVNLTPFPDIVLR